MQEKKPNALLTACKYSYQPNLLGYCGPLQAHRIFLRFIQNQNEKNAASAKKALQQFYGCYSYLRLIAESNSLQPLDSEVIEAYWIGNDLLHNVSHADLQNMILNEFAKPGLLPRKIAEQKAAAVNSEMLAHHSFHVLHVNFITKKVKPLVQNLSNCLIQWGKVLELNPEKKKMLVKGIELFSESNELKLREKEKQVSFGFIENAAVGSTVSIHWNSAIEVLDKDRAEKLQHCTMQNLQAIQSSQQ